MLQRRFKVRRRITVEGQSCIRAGSAAATFRFPFEFRAEMYNAFNNTNFSVGLGSKGTTFGQVTSADSARSVTLVGRLNF